MQVIVSDTSVLIDLERGNILDGCFKLPFELAVPDLLYLKELEGYGGAELVAKGLRVEELTGQELQAAQAARIARPRLSLPDAYAFSLASSRGWALLTGDGQLRALADASGVVCRGTLWICDQLYETAAMQAAAVADGLELIAAHPRCRLPRAEIQVRIARFRSRADS